MGCASSSPSGGGAGDAPVKPRPGDKGSMARGKASIVRDGGGSGQGQKPASPPHKLRNRQMTMNSDKVLDLLDDMELEYKAMKELSDSAAITLGNGDIPTGLRSDLASLHGTANKMLATRVDSLLTSDLTTGRDEARARRKALVATLEELIERTEQQIKFVDRRKAGDESEDLKLLLALPKAPTTQVEGADEGEVQVAFPAVPDSSEAAAPAFPQVPAT